MSHPPIPRVQFPPIKTLTDVDRLLIQADGMLLNGRRAAGLIGQAIVHILNEMPHLTIVYLESRYRALASDTFLIAAPIPVGMRAVGIDRQPKIYHMWIEVNGVREAERVMQQYSIEDADENRQRLAKCGLLVAV